MKFIVLTTPRTGSELLIEGLGHHPDLNVAGELLNPHRGTEWRTAKFRELFDADQLPYTANVNLLETESTIRYHQTDQLAAFVESAMSELDGFKITFDQIEHTSPVVGSLAGDRKMKVIFLERNHVQSAVSFWFAVRSQKWQRQAGDPPVADAPEFVDPEFVNKFCSQARLDNSHYRAVFAGHESATIGYDELVSDWSGVLARVQTFLNVPVVGLPVVFNKRLTRPLSEVVTNYRTLVPRRMI